MSPRNLPFWARGATVALMFGAAWFATGSPALTERLGESITALVAGVVAISVLFGLRAPLYLWPASQVRPRFSWALALSGTLVLSAAVVLTRPLDLVDQLVSVDRSGLALATLGAGGVSLSIGAAQNRALLHWYALALGAGMGAFIAAFPAAAGGGFSIEGLGGKLLLAAGGYLAIEICRGLITTELAFRRVIVGTGAGMAAVLGAAVVYAAWLAVFPPLAGSTWQLIVAGLALGITAGTLYALSGALLVSALYVAAAMSTLRAADLIVPPLDTGVQIWSSATFWLIWAGTNFMVGGLLAGHLFRRRGWFGAQLPPPRQRVAETDSEDEPDATGN